MGLQFNQGSAGSDATAVRNATRVKFNKWLKEFQVSMNPLDPWFKMEPTLAQRGYFDYVNTVDSWILDGDSAQRVANTPNAQTPSWRRRRNRLMEAPIHIAIPRADAKRLGVTHPILVSEYEGLMKKAMARVQIGMMMRMFTNDFVDNPVMEDGATSTQQHTDIFGATNEHMFAGNAATDTTPGSAASKAGVFSAPPRIAEWFYLTASLANARKLGIARGGMLSEDTGVKKASKCLVICSNTAFAHWKRINVDIIGNRDTFGKDVYLGEGKLYDFQEYSFLTLPDEYVPQAVSQVIGGNTFNDAYGSVEPSSDFTANDEARIGFAGGGFRTLIQFPKPSTWAGMPTPLLTARIDRNAPNAPTTSYAGTVTDVVDDDNHCSIRNMFPMYVIEPNAMRFQSPKQLIVPAKSYSDFTKSMETFVFQNSAIEGIRLFTPLLRRVWMTGPAQNGIFADETI